MTTPFAALAVMTKSAHAYSVEPTPSTSPVLHPFAHLDPFVKEAGFFGDIGDGIWNSTAKPLGNAIGQLGKGVGQLATGVGTAAGNLVAAPYRAMGGAIGGGWNAMQRGGNLGQIAQGAVDGGWNAGANTARDIGWGGGQALRGAGNTLAGGGKTLWSMNPITAVGRGVQGLGAGIDTGINNKIKQFGVGQQSGGTNGAMPPGMQMIPPGQDGSIMQGPPAPGTPANPTPAPGVIAPGQNNLQNNMQPAYNGSNPMLDHLGGGATSGYGQGFNPGPTPYMGAPRPVGGSPSPVSNAPSYQGPTDDDYRRVMGSYDPSSPFDQRKAQAISSAWQRNGGRMSPNQMYQDPGYMDIQKSSALTPFAHFEKEAGAKRIAMEVARRAAGAGGEAAQVVAKAKPRSISSRIAQQAEEAAQIKAPTGAPRGPRVSRQPSPVAPQPQPEIGRISDSMRLPPIPQRSLPFNVMAPGNLPLPASIARNADPTLMQRYYNLRADNPALLRKLQYSAAGAGGAGLLYGSNRMGHSSGMDEGLSKGFDTGADHGIQAALASAPKDPGLFGRIADVFTGQQAGPQAYDIQSMLDANKAQILKQLRAA